MGKFIGEFLRFWGNSGEIWKVCGEIFLERVGHPVTLGSTRIQEQDPIRRRTAFWCRTREIKNSPDYSCIYLIQVPFLPICEALERHERTQYLGPAVKRREQPGGGAGGCSVPGSFYYGGSGKYR